MKRIIILCYITLISFLSWVSVTARPFSSHDVVTLTRQQAQFSEPPQAALFASTNDNGNNEEEYRAESRIGSRPPNCGHKCGGCLPCDPVQTPATTDRVGVQIANYEPEGWKCKCGLSFFNP